MTPLDWLTVAAAFITEQMVDVPADAPAWWAIAGGVGWMLWAAALRWISARVRAHRIGVPRSVITGCMALVAAVPPPTIAAVAAWEGFATACGGEGASPEALLLAGCRGMLTAVLVAGTTVSETRFALAATLPLVVLAAIVTEHPMAPLVQALYAAVATATLAGWAERRSSNGSTPGPVGLASSLAVAATVATLGGTRDACGRAVVGWLPLSGGHSIAFPWARDGLGDGENLVAAEKAPQTTGPVTSGIFATSHKPTLYDIFNDLYGEPPKPGGNERQRAFDLGPQDLPMGDQHLADSEHAGREFTTVRNRSSRPQRPTSDIAARSLVTVTGPTPAHLRLAVYDAFDGRSWRARSPTPADTDAHGLVHAGGAWMQWTGSAAIPEAGPAEVHAITMGSLETTLLPLPPRARALRIDRIDRPDFFRTPLADVVTLDGIGVPAGTTVHVRSLPGGVDAGGAVDVVAAPAITVSSSEPMPTWVDGVLDDWGLRDDPAIGTWPHVERLVAEVGRRLERDDAVIVPVDCADTLEHALTGTRRGRAFDFAGAVVVLLRRCGYDTRLVGGLHVSGSRRDPRSRRLVATADDAHVWAEIRDVTGRWVPIEATPGFGVRKPAVSLAARVLAWFRSVVACGRADAPTIAAALAGAVIATVVARRAWPTCVDAAGDLWWRLAVARHGTCPIRAAWQLLAWRAWLAGCAKRRDETLRDWQRRTLVPAALGAATLPFVAAFEEAVYGHAPAAHERRNSYRVARATVSAVTIARLRGRPARPRPAPVPHVHAGGPPWRRS